MARSALASESSFTMNSSEILHEFPSENASTGWHNAHRLADSILGPCGFRSAYNHESIEQIICYEFLKEDYITGVLTIVIG